MSNKEVKKGFARMKITVPQWMRTEINVAAQRRGLARNDYIAEVFKAELGLQRRLDGQRSRTKAAKGAPLTAFAQLIASIEEEQRKQRNNETTKLNEHTDT